MSSANAATEPGDDPNSPGPRHNPTKRIVAGCDSSTVELDHARPFLDDRVMIITGWVHRFSVGWFGCNGVRSLASIADGGFRSAPS